MLTAACEVCTRPTAAGEALCASCKKRRARRAVCAVCGNRLVIEGDGDLCSRCVWLGGYIADCPMCDKAVYAESERVEMDGWHYHADCHEVFARYRWALDNPLL